jgi:hypothetical protein
MATIEELLPVLWRMAAALPLRGGRGRKPQEAESVIRRSSRYNHA